MIIETKFALGAAVAAVGGAVLGIASDVAQGVLLSPALMVTLGIQLGSMVVMAAKMLADSRTFSRFIATMENVPTRLAAIEKELEGVSEWVRAEQAADAALRRRREDLRTDSA